ncbi:MAG TPA: ABC transporter ATP-binding protein [Microvirga sp.]|nr:ABC transporter ATP-binding protein [Microvirga sp.]
MTQGSADVPALAVEGLSHSFGPRPALDGVAFRIAPGSFTILLGPNGAGKTTLVSLATGLYAARSGEVRIFGHPLRREPLAGLARLGVVFQAPTLDLDLTVAENLAYHGALHGLSRRAALERAREELDRLGILERLPDRARCLSGGLRRRVEIARALLSRPGLLLVDEGTAGLDVAARRALLDHVRSLCRDRGLAVLWATHLLDEVEPGDPLLVLHEGRIRFDGAAGNLAAGASLRDAFLGLTGDAL